MEKRRRYGVSRRPRSGGLFVFVFGIDFQKEVDPVSTSKSDHYKNKGNKFFEHKDYLGGYLMYLESLRYTVCSLFSEITRIQPKNIPVLMNLAAAASPLKKHDEAINAANLALKLTDGKMAKAWYR